MAQTKDITLLHFNDVYHISDAEHVARFASVLADPRYITDDVSAPEQQLRLFSGDAFSPSLEASVLRGEHIPTILNAMNIDLACYGNHDFDFGEARLIELSRITKFPWMLTNVLRRGQPSIHRRDDKLLALANEYVVREIDGLRIGFFGLAGTDWPSNCQHLPSCNICDPTSVAQTTARYLRESVKCDLVIALTHMRLAEDVIVSQNTKDGSGRVDLILGGHDHDIVQRASTDFNNDPRIPGTTSGSATGVSSTEDDIRIIKSGTDWNGLSVLRLTIAKSADGKSSISKSKLYQFADLKSLPNYADIPPCPNTMKAIADVQAKIAKLVEKPLVMAAVPLEGRSRIVRGRESNLGNMLADVVRSFYNTEIAFVNSGAIRCDRIIDPGRDEPLRIRDIIDISPFDNAFVVKRVSGHILALALENSVSDAHTDGRFLHLSGLTMLVDWSRPEGQRVGDIMYVPKHGKPRHVKPRDMYTVAMVDFIASGFDGYSWFRSCETLLDAEGSMTDTNLLLQVFEADGRGDAGGQLLDEAAEGIKRAQRAVIRGRHPDEGLPVISPSIEGRIRVITPNL
ncbi:2,3-cyclic-nucleotide 2-phosphodiesterase [Nannizzia gypsea CBS 118893]|uniref:2,3-cyclic-nucleotide 2-phosphodiesterase n=1 Tax=Arthroderma gypseum (strain ATCC MYA-4604 / CBS 118893) TaxID=535722 RepID=E4US95_ARTGP|nr:2,3-cyclic-nucleotide 2-phosphodiesterase [Nannizzia gypsea CBS 118893]EFR01299.1 2,3-cyclic-nucleotide 2-phosphodiesterase [Nannizzia gypsea CBS 118893]